jgi:hypothetical protein
VTVKIDAVEPNIFPDVEDLDARDAGRNVEVFLDIRVEGKQTPVTVKLSYEQASDLAILLEPAFLLRSSGSQIAHGNVSIAKRRSDWVSKPLSAIHRDRCDPGSRRR